jgi:hypothetical protein
MTRVNCTHWCFVSQNSKTGALDTLSTISPPTDKDDKSSTNPPSNRTTRSRRFPEPNVVLRCDGDRYRVRSRHAPDPGAAEWGNDRPLARTLGSARPHARRAPIVRALDEALSKALLGLSAPAPGGILGFVRADGRLLGGRTPRHRGLDPRPTSPCLSGGQETPPGFSSRAPSRRSDERFRRR